MSNTELSANGDEWREVFMRYVGRGRHIRFDDLSEDSGVKRGSLRSIAAGDYSPRWREFKKIVPHLPKGALDILLRPLGYTAHPLQFGGCDKKTASTMARAVAELTHALEDGDVNHLERADIIPKAELAYEELGKWLSGTTKPVIAVVHNGPVNGRDRPA